MPPKPAIPAQVMRRAFPSLHLRTIAPPPHIFSQQQRHITSSAPCSSQINARPLPSQLIRQRWPSQQVRANSSTSASIPLAPQSTPSTTTQGEEGAEDEETAPRREFQMTFTCRMCKTRSSHKVSHQGYYSGTILIQCPGCQNRHLICDHLKIFRDKSVTLEDLMREKGELVKRGSLGSDGDVEFWDEPGQQQPPTDGTK